MSRFDIQRRSRLSVFAILLFASLISACASTARAPVGELERARQAIANAEQARAAEHAPLQLAQARDKLDAANDAADNRQMDVAERRAHEARVLAEYAFARAEMEDAARINSEIVKTTEILREEINRSQQMGGPR